MKGSPIGWLVLLSALMTAGCARVATTTTIAADGSFSRKSAYTVSKSSGLTGGSSQESPQKPEDFFSFPSGSAVKASHSEDTQSYKVTVTREVAAGAAPLQDISLLAGKGKVMATSTVSVKRLADGKIEYLETLRATQPNSRMQNFVVPELRAVVKSSLPEAYRKTEFIDAATKGVMLNFFHALFGPPEPSVFNLLINPEGTARRMNAIAFDGNVRVLRQTIPDLTEAQAVSSAKQIAQVLNSKMMDSASGKTPDDNKESGPNDMTPLYFEIAFPGKVVETNGLIDPVTGEVYWSLLATMLDLGEVQLRAVIQP